MTERDEDFEALLEASLAEDARAGARRLRRGQVVTGTVIQISEDSVFVDVGTKAEAQIERHELEDRDGKLKVAVGDSIKATVAQPEGRSGPKLVVSLGRGSADVSTLQLALESGTPVEGEVLAAVKAGLEVDVGGVRAFCPASQIDLGYTAQLEQFVGQTHFFKVLEVRDAGRSVVLSRRAVLAQEQEMRAHELAKRLEKGTELDGIVHSIKPYGVFVDIGGIHGLVHVSELSHTRVSRPEDAVSVGERVRVKVLSVEEPVSGKPRDLKVSLSMKALTTPPEPQDLEVDEIISATVTKVESFGAFVDTPAGSGLVPNRELGLSQGTDPRRAFPVGTQVDVILLSREPGSGKMRFSIQAVAAAQERRDYRDFTRGKSRGSSLGSLGDLLRDKVSLEPEKKPRKGKRKKP